LKNSAAVKAYYMSLAAAPMGQENFSCKNFYRGSWIRKLFSCLDFSGNRLAIIRPLADGLDLQNDVH